MIAEYSRWAIGESSRQPTAKRHMMLTTLVRMILNIFLLDIIRMTMFLQVITMDIPVKSGTMNLLMDGGIKKNNHNYKY